MLYNEQTEGDTLVIGLQGRLDMEAEGDLMNSFGQWLESNHNFVLNCKELEFMDSTGLGVLLRLLKQAMKRDGDIRLAELNEPVRMVFEITRADKIFQIFPSTEEAISSYLET